MSVFRDDLLKGKTAFITGGGTGICKGIAMVFAGHGANLAITSRKQENLDIAAEEIREATGAKVVAIAADVRKPEEIERVVESTVGELGGIDILVNGAAGNFPVSAEELSYNGFRTVVDIDLQGTFNVSKACFPHLKVAGQKHRNASVLAISATLHYTGVPNQAHVCAAKAGVDALMRTLANEWGPLGIRANVVSPGPIAETEGMRRLAPTSEALDRSMKRVPLGRFGTIREIADACLFLVSDASKFTNGAILVVDGGQWLYSRGLG